MRRLLIAGLATFVIGLVVLFPARVAWTWFAPPGVVLSGIDGSIWRGSARAASVGGVYLRDLAWRWLPGSMLSGRIAYALEAIPGSGFVKAEIGIAPAGSVYVDELRGSLPLPAFETLAGTPGIQGTANVALERLELAGGRPTIVDGTIEVAGLVVPLISPAPLGRYRAEFQTQDDGTIVGSVRDDGAVVDLAGRLQLSGEREYNFLGYVAANGSTPQNLVRQMQFLGSPNAQGQYELRLSGRY